MSSRLGMLAACSTWARLKLDGAILGDRRSMRNRGGHLIELNLTGYCRACARPGEVQIAE